MRVPMTAKEQLQAARELGHEFTVVTRDFPERGVPSKYYVTCTCGYESAVRRSRAGASSGMIRHMVIVLAEAHDRAV